VISVSSKLLRGRWKVELALTVYALPPPPIS
jgi:hypothetical protein